MSTNIIKYNNSVNQAVALAKVVAQELDRVIQKNGRASLVVPGGSTPERFLIQLSFETIDWSKVMVTLTDERWVPSTNERSNFSLLQKALGQNKAEDALFLPLYHEAEGPEEALMKLEDSLAAHLPIDVCVVGMGEDMHTASLFPNAEGLSQALLENGPYLVPIRLHSTDEVRISLTASVFCQVASHHILIKGERKLEALKQAESESSVFDAPIKLILKQPLTQVHYTP